MRRLIGGASGAKAAETRAARTREAKERVIGLQREDAFEIEALSDVARASSS
jgi:hypothetical protein